MSIKRTTLTLCLLLSITMSSFGQMLSDQATVSLITVSPGQDLYSKFGHSAIWINDTTNNINRVYNYGTFDFNTPNFYVKFCKGQLDYMLSVDYFQRTLKSAIDQNRSVYEQQINLSQTQKESIYRYLERNALPENKNYKYDFFFDNCSSRIRDVFKEICGEDLVFDQNIIKEKSYRQLMNMYLEDIPYIALAMNIAIGTPADQIANPEGYMYLPNELMDNFDVAKIVNKEGGKYLVSKTKRHFTAKQAESKSPFMMPQTLFWLILLIVIGVTALELWLEREFFVFDGILFTLVGLIGIILVFLWFFTDHSVTPNNWNVLWAFPLHFPIALWLFKNRAGYFISYYFLLTGVLILIAIMGWSFFPQELHYALIPFVPALGIRSFLLYFKLKPSNEIYLGKTKMAQICADVMTITRSAGKLIQEESKRFDASKIESKGLNDLVSYVDKDAEQLIVAELKKIIPDAGFITEEATVSQGDKRYTWIVDPLDGTANFMHGIPVYSISIALMEEGKLVVGVVYDIPNDDYYYAYRGAGAFLNGEEIKISSAKNLSDSMLATGFPYANLNGLEPYMNILQEFMAGTHGIRRMGSCAIDLAFVAAGKYDGFFEYNMNPWDVAAGAFILEKAGGEISDFSGGDNWLYGKEIVASNGEIHPEMVAIIKKYWQATKPSEESPV